MERVRGIEPPLSAWEADVLPLNYTRVTVWARHLSRAARRSTKGIATTCYRNR